MTFVSTATMVRHVGAEVVFADVDPDTGLMGAAQFAEALERAGAAPVKAVIPVHLGGQCADLAEIAELAAERGIRVVEDACHAIGTRYGDTLVGSCRDSIMAVFSFHPVKTVVMGEGGAVTTNDEGLRDRLALLRNHGMTRDPSAFVNAGLAFDAEGAPNPWYYEMAEAGFNYRVSDINCALGLSQLGKLDRFAARRRELAARYDDLLAPLSPVARPVKRTPGCKAAWHLYQALIDFEAAGITRAALMSRLRADGIGTQVHYIPVHRQPYYADRYGELDLPGADAFYGRCLSLPLSPGLTEDDVRYVAGALSRIIE
jgi:dTDP-4-amino-4,6-dideoxygalactose transaminase